MNGVGQLTLVEHSLCPLDNRSSMSANLVHETSFKYSDKDRRRRTGRVRVLCPLGLLAHDELVLWGCLALTLADRQSEGQLVATRHYILRQLGLVDAGSRRGGRQYDKLTSAIERLSAVRYLNDSFYDPMRAEHRRVSFGFFSYSMPNDPDSSRAWRIVWDPVFIEFLGAAGGSLRFDLPIYRKLDPASRRLFLFVTKLFARSATSYPLDVTRLAVDVLGFSPSIRPSDLKFKVTRCIQRLMTEGVLAKGDGVVRKTGIGQYRVVLRKGKAYSANRRSSQPVESPLVESLRAIGVDEPGIGRVLREFRHSTVGQWVDITLAAKERFGSGFFRRSPAAYFMDNLRATSDGTRTPPDWWHDIRRAEERAQAERFRKLRAVNSATDQLPTKANEVLSDIQDAIFRRFNTTAPSKPEAPAAGECMSTTCPKQIRTS